MADYLVTDTELTSVANAIRTKGGTSANLSFPTGFVSAIQAIGGGGIIPVGSLSITDNGTFDVTNYASAEVNVPQIEVETGTFTPSSDVTDALINFTNTHSTYPSLVVIIDQSTTKLPDTSAYYATCMAVMNVKDLFGNGAPSYNSLSANTDFLITVGTKGNSTSKSVSILTGHTVPYKDTCDTGTGVSHYISKSQFRAVSYNSSHMFRTNRRYRWVAWWYKWS